MTVCQRSAGLTHFSCARAIGAILCLPLLSHCGSSGGGASAPATSTVPTVTPTLGLSWHQSTYEAEAGTLSGAASIVGASDGSDRAVGDLGGEASGRQAVVLTNAGDAVAWTVQATEAGANAIVVRFSAPDAPGGGGAPASLAFSAANAAGQVRTQATLQLTSRYAWLYGGVMDGTKLYNVPANAAQYATASTPTHLYDEIQLKLGVALQAGDVLTLSKTTGSGAVTIAVDFIELETVPAPLPQPTGYLSITDASCGAISLDLRQTASVFDGADDSSYASVFNAVIGSNPYNPTGSATQEKDYYTNIPADPLQDTSPNSAAGGLSMFDLADHNLQSLQTCVDLVAASPSQYNGVWIPPGRYYVRGQLPLPSAMSIQGAGMWYSKFTAVDTAPPAPASDNGQTGIAGVSGNFVITSATAGADSVVLANFAIFGNVTQRDVVDDLRPIGVHGQFTRSTFDNLWVEHVYIGLNADGASDTVKISNSRVRNTFADGIDFYGSTSHSLIIASQSRSTGDDGFALWAQGDTLATVSQDNAVTNSTASLQWFGNGFAVYGGNGGSISQSSAADILNYPCLQISSQFVPSTLPSSATMSASASSVNFYRCGGNGFNQQFGALLIGADLESLDGISVEHANIAAPTYKGVDIRPIPAPAGGTVVASINSASISSTEVLAAPACAAIAAEIGGSLQLDGVCSCASVGATPAACTITNASSSTFQVPVNTCSATACSSF